MPAARWLDPGSGGAAESGGGLSFYLVLLWLHDRVWTGFSPISRIISDLILGSGKKF